MRAMHVRFLFLLVALSLFVGVCLGACSNGASPAGASSDAVLGKYEPVSLESYECFSDYAGDYAFVSMTVQDIVAEMDAGSTFVVAAGFSNCPWCNTLFPYLNEVAIQHGATVGYLDTRANPEWKSNIDIDDYDLFAERFGSVLEADDDGTPHLYVPHVFFIKDGQLVDDHAGTVSGQESASDELSAEQQEELRSILNAGFDALA